MTNGSDRARWTDEQLDRLASFIFANAEAIRESNEQLTQVERLTQSNSRAIQAMLDAQASARLQRAELQSAITDINEAIQRLTTLNEGVVNLLSSLDSDRPTILRKLNTIENSRHESRVLGEETPND